jgi:hypothetical protein
MENKKSSGSGRTRNWNIIVYPESAPENWRDIINEQHIQWVESPLHDKDIDEDGEPKKAHWHILLLYRGVKTFDQVRELTDMMSAPIPQKCHDTRGSIRYMAHQDTPDKHQYDKNAVVAHGGADLAAMCAPTATEVYALKCQIEEFICDNHITEYSVLLDLLRRAGEQDMHKIAQENTIYCNAYISSKRNIHQNVAKSN